MKNNLFEPKASTKPKKTALDTSVDIALSVVTVLAIVSLFTNLGYYCQANRSDSSYCQIASEINRFTSLEW